MGNIITHQGVVESRDGDHVFVRIIQTSGCASCSVKGHCSMADSKEKVLEIHAPASSCAMGDRVTVVGQTAMGMMAVILAFFIPFLILIVSLFVLMYFLNGNELLSGLLSLSLLIPYYFAIWLKRDSLKKNFVFTIKTNK